MSKLNLLSQIGFSLAIVGFTSTAHAQLPTTSPQISPPQSTPTPSISPAPAPTPTSTPTPTPTPASKSPDVKLFSRAVEIFWRTQRAQTDSQIEIDGSNNQDASQNFKGYATVKTIAQTGYKFRSDIKVAKALGAPTIAYTVVCDGAKVWIYRPDKRQYTQTTLADFQRQSYSYAIGLSSIFFLSMNEKDRQGLATTLSPNRKDPLDLPQDTIKDLNGSLQNINGQQLYVYSYENKQDKTNFIGYIHPQTAAIKQVEFIGMANSSELKINEKIINRINLNASNVNIFKFLPPKGVKKVNSLAIDLI